MNLKRTLLFASAFAFTVSAQAELTTETESQTYSGKAGSTSSETGVSPLVFSYFDSALGELTGVHIVYNFQTSGGLVGAENLSNQQVTGNVELGSGLFLDFSSVVDYLSLDPITSKQSGSFTLAAQDSVANSGADYYSLTGTENNVSSPLITLDNSYFLDAFKGTGNYSVDFSTTSITSVNTEGGVQGFFQAVDTVLNMSVYYSYEEYPKEPGESDISNVPAPLIGVMGLSMLGFASYRKKKKS